MDYALYTGSTENAPAGTADGLLKRNAANNGWEFKTAAELGLTATLKQTLFAQITVDTTTTSAAFVDLLTQAITITAGSKVIINFTASANNSNVSLIQFQITIDGAAVRGASSRVSQNNTEVCCSIVYERLGLAAGAHTVKIQWRTTAGTARIRPVATVVEHASLILQEVTV
jgi:hypothetical protein